MHKQVTHLCTEGATLCSNGWWSTPCQVTAAAAAKAAAATDIAAAAAATATAFIVCWSCCCRYRCAFHCECAVLTVGKLNIWCGLLALLLESVYGVAVWPHCLAGGFGNEATFVFHEKMSRGSVLYVPLPNGGYPQHTSTRQWGKYVGRVGSMHIFSPRTPPHHPPHPPDSLARASPSQARTTHSRRFSP
jgi:hypothetical protein